MQFIDMYYFAYGSNMDGAQMRKRCSNFALIGPALLKNYRIAFTIFSPRRKCGCADIIPSVGSAAPGLLYEIHEKDIENFDRYENVKEHMYRRVTVSVIGNDGAMFPCETYEVVHKTEGLLPSKEYIGVMRTAAEKFSFPEKHVRFLADMATI